MLSLSDGLHAYFRDINILTAENGKKAVEVLGLCTFDMVMTDLKMPGMDGFELVEYMRAHQPALTVVVMTAFSDEKTWHRLKKMGIRYMIEKPVDLHEMTSIVERMENESCSC